MPRLGISLDAVILDVPIKTTLLAFLSPIWTNKWVVDLSICLTQVAKVYEGFLRLWTHIWFVAAFITILAVLAPVTFARDVLHHLGVKWRHFFMLKVIIRFISNFVWCNSVQGMQLTKVWGYKSTRADEVWVGGLALSNLTTIGNVTGYVPVLLRITEFGDDWFSLAFCPLFCL